MSMAEIGQAYALAIGVSMGSAALIKKVTVSLPHCIIRSGSFVYLKDLL